MLNIQFDFKVVSTLSLVPQRASADVSDEKRVESSGPSPKVDPDKKGITDKALAFIKKIATAFAVKKFVEILTEIFS